VTWRTPSYDSGGGPDPTHPPRGPEQSASPPILAARVGGSTSSQAAGRLTARSRAPRAAGCALEPGDAPGGETARGGAAAGRAGRPGSRGRGVQLSTWPEHGGRGGAALCAAAATARRCGARAAERLRRRADTRTRRVQRAESACACVRHSCALGFTCPHSPHSQPPPCCVMAPGRERGGRGASISLQREVTSLR